MLVQQPFNSNQITLSSSQRAYYTALKNFYNQTEEDKLRKRHAQLNYLKKRKEDYHQNYYNESETKMLQ